MGLRLSRKEEVKASRELICLPRGQGLIGSAQMRLALAGLRPAPPALLPELGRRGACQGVRSSWVFGSCAWCRSVELIKGTWDGAQTLTSALI